MCYLVTFADLTRFSNSYVLDCGAISIIEKMYLPHANPKFSANFQRLNQKLTTDGSEGLFD
jgi:hypothetical protein